MRTLAIIVWVVCLAAPACDGNDESAGALTGFAPGRAYTDAAVPAVLRGGPFRPSFSIDTSSGAASLDVGAFAGALWPTQSAASNGPAVLEIAGLADSGTLNVSVPAGLPKGVYDIELRDPRGRVSLLASGFRSLGSDTDAPEVSLAAPLGGTFVVVGSNVPVIVNADDGEGQLAALAWTLITPDGALQTHTCPTPQGASASCSDGEITVPDGGNLLEPMILRTVAQDQAGNVGSREDTLFRAHIPVVTSVAPTAGPAMGMTQIVVRGQGFVRATRVLIDGAPITPNGGIYESDTVIRGFTLAHEPGSWPVVVQTGDRLVVGPLFSFVQAPVVRRVNPDHGPSTGGTTVTIVGSHFVCEGPGTMGTRFSVGAGVVRVDVMVTDCGGPNRVVGTMPPYPLPPDGTGTVSMFAVDPAAGESELPNAFTYNSLPPPAPPAAP